MKQSHFTVIELNNDEAPMIGTFDNISDNKVSLNYFRR